MPLELPSVQQISLLTVSDLLVQLILFLPKLLLTLKDLLMTLCLNNLVPKPGKGSAPSFIKTIQPVSAQVGQLVRLDVRISGSPPLEVHWIRDGEEVLPDITHKLVQEGDLHTLLILEASPLDKGVYDCVVFNKSGEVRCTATVDIRQGDKSSSESSKQGQLASGPQTLAPAASSSSPGSSSTPVSPPQVVEPLKDITVQEGKMAVFKARVTNASSEFSLVYLFIGF